MSNWYCIVNRLKTNMTVFLCSVCQTSTVLSLFIHNQSSCAAIMGSSYSNIGLAHLYKWGQTVKWSYPACLDQISNKEILDTHNNLPHCVVYHHMLVKAGWFIFDSGGTWFASHLEGTADLGCSAWGEKQKIYIYLRSLMSVMMLMVCSI